MSSQYSQSGLQSKSSLATMKEKSETADHAADNVFDTPKSLSRATTGELPLPSRPHPAVTKLPNASVHTVVSHTDDLEKGASADADADADGLSGNPYALDHEYSLDVRTKDCTMWPSRHSLKAKARREKYLRRRNNCCGLSARWGAMEPRSRVLAKVLLALVVISVAVGVAIGITRAVHGGVWSGNNASKQIAGS